MPGGTFFFTLVTQRRRPVFKGAQARTLLRQSMAEVQRRRPFAMEGIVLLPDHLHCIWVLPPDDPDFSTRWRKVKEGFTRGYLAEGAGEADITVGQARKGLRGVWQPRFWEHTIRDERDFERHMDYIHFNPVRHGYASCPHRWPWSSFRKWVKCGIYELTWCCTCRGRRPRIPDFKEVDATAVE